MLRRALGQSGFDLNAIGLGCMGLSEFYGPATDTGEAVKLLHTAIERGVDHFDTAEMYGMGANERLLGEAFHDRRDKVRIATKFGPTRDPETTMPTGVDGSPANCRRAIEQSLGFLKTDHVDLYYLHRVDKSTPIEETVGAMAELVKEGKVLALGLSEASADTIRRANAVHPIAAIQSEYSIFSRDIEADVLPAITDIGATLVAYSPLGRGMLTGAIATPQKLEDGDLRNGAWNPRWEEDNFKANLALVDEVKAVATAHNATPSQVAIAWVLGRGDNIITIPGTTKLKNLEGNLAGADVALTSDETTRLDALADKVQGTRYNEQGMAAVNA